MITVSKKIDFENINNIRDLGGILTKDGKEINSNKLIRSGSLFKATDNDKRKLSEFIGLIIDLRSDDEITLKPDPSFNNVKYVCLPVSQRQKKISITRTFAENPEGAREYMMNNYISLVSSSFSNLSFQKFVNLLLQKNDKTALWHCSAGKDRTGFATILVLELLEVNRDTIFEDYLYSNNCQQEDFESLILRLMKKYEIDENSIEKTSAFKKTVEYIYRAKEDYFLCLYDKIKKLYGDFDGFINKGLKISDNQRTLFKDLYLK